MNTQTTGLNNLSKWHVYHIDHKDLSQPKYKYMICVCPVSEGFFYVSSDPSQGRKAREYDVIVEPFQLSFLRHTSYINTRNIKCFDDNRVAESRDNQKPEVFDRQIISPTLIRSIKGMVQNNPALTDAEKELIIIQNENNA